jgi:hypothetical protein
MIQPHLATETLQYTLRKSMPTSFGTLSNRVAGNDLHLSGMSFRLDALIMNMHF